MALVRSFELTGSIHARVPEIRLVDEEADPNFWARIMVKRIVQRCHPVMVILFGPCVGGEELYTEAYYNLLVVFSEIADKREMNDIVERALAGLTLGDYSICVTLRDLVEDDDRTTLQYVALTKGKVIYSNLQPSDLDVWLSIMVKRIVKHFDPVKIVASGSCVGGDECVAGGHLNLMVVFHELSNAGEMNAAIGNALADIPVDYNVFSMSLKEFEYYRDDPSSPYYLALAEGRVIYDVQSDLKYWVAIMVKRVVERFHPAKVILLSPCFGGDEHNIQSDVDLVLVFPELSNTGEMNTAIRNVLADIPVNYNVCSMTLTEFEYHSNDSSSLYHVALTDEDKVLYYYDPQYWLYHRLNYWTLIMVKRIVELFQPVRVFLLGPCFAGGEFLSESDVNLVVVFSELSSKNEMEIRIRDVLADVPVDYSVFPTSLREIEACADARSSVYYLALTEGKVIYEQES